MREFLGGRIMVPYPEAWMDRVDTMKRLQGWTDTTVTDFRDLAIFGEQLLLSIRYGHWSDVHDSAHAANWARYWRPEIQSYIHAYRAVTGVDLTAEADWATGHRSRLAALRASAPPAGDSTRTTACGRRANSGRRRRSERQRQAPCCWPAQWLQRRDGIQRGL